MAVLGLVRPPKALQKHRRVGSSRVPFLKRGLSFCKRCIRVGQTWFGVIGDTSLLAQAQANWAMPKDAGDLGKRVCMGNDRMAGTGMIGARGLRRAILGLMIMVIAACTPVYRNHGYVPTDDELSQIIVGKDTRETLAPLIGRPSAAAILNDTGWYYVQSRWKNYGARPPKEIDRQVVAITFDEKGVVSNVERFGLEGGKVVALSRRITTDNIKGVSFLRQLLGSLGNFRSGQAIQ